MQPEPAYARIGPKRTPHETHTLSLGFVGPRSLSLHQQR